MVRAKISERQRISKVSFRSSTSNSGYKQPDSTPEGCASKNGTCLGLPTSESGSNSPSEAHFMAIQSETAIRLSGRWAPTRELEGTRLPVPSGKGPTENGTLNSAGANLI